MSRLTVPEVAEEWRCTAQHVSDEIRRGNLRAAKVGGRWLVEEADAKAYLVARANIRPVKPPRLPRRRAS